MFEKVTAFFLSFISLISSAFSIPLGDRGVTVNYDYVNGQSVKSSQVFTGSLLIEPKTPQKRGLIFDGWYSGKKKWDFKNGIADKDIKLKAKWSFSETFFDKDPNAGNRTEDSNLRVMSFNILSSEFNNKPKISGRDKLVLDILTRYKPDVVGVQESDPGWYKVIKKNFSDYRFANESNNKINGVVNYTTILYNAKSISLLKCEQKAYEVRDSEKCRNITWALFESKFTEEQFIVVSTHWEVTQKKRKEEAKELAKVVKDLKKKYDFPIFCTEDYNSNEKDDEYSIFIKNSGFEDAKYTSKSKGLVAATFHLGDGTGSEKDYNSGYWKLGKESYRDDKINTINSIDHIFCSAGENILYYDTVADLSAMNASDHCPIYVDVKL